MSLSSNKRRIIFVFGLLIIISCLVIFSFVGSFLKRTSEPSQEQTQFIFEQYILSSDSELNMTDVSEIQVKTIGMGQGVYIRFEAKENFISKMVETRSTQSSYEPIPCGEFLNAYPADIAASIKWWEPQEIATPVCYYAETGRYLLIDRKNGVVYYYSFPDFLG